MHSANLHTHAHVMWNCEWFCTCNGRRDKITDEVAKNHKISYSFIAKRLRNYFNFVFAKNEKKRDDSICDDVNFSLHLYPDSF